MAGQAKKAASVAAICVESLGQDGSVIESTTISLPDAKHSHAVQQVVKDFVMTVLLRFHAQHTHGESK